MKTFVTVISTSTGRNILYLIYGFGMVTCTVYPLSRFTAHLLPVYRATYKWTGDTKQSRLESTTEITQNKHVKVLHYFVDDIKLGYFVWKITILRQKIIFFPILGGGCAIFSILAWLATPTRKYNVWNSRTWVTWIILRPLSALSLDEVNAATSGRVI